MTNSIPKISCIILAGGEGKRVDGRDKGLIIYQNKTLIKHVIDAIKPQTDEIIISANRNLEVYKLYGYKVVTDEADEYRGPLAGIAAGLPHCKNDWVLVVPCDMPFLPSHLAEKLYKGKGTAKLSIAETEGNLQLTYLMNSCLQASLTQSLQSNQLRLMQWVKSQKPSSVAFTQSHCLTNFNHSSELA